MYWLLLLLTAALFGLRAEPFDLLITGGRIIDGTGSPAVFRDIAIRDGRIAKIGTIDPAAAKDTLNASGLFIAPGFIDVHTHAEEITDYPESQNFIRMGVTTILIGNCGSSTTDVADYFRKLEAADPVLNVATLIGHNSVRSKIMGGSFDRPPSQAELLRMKEMVTQAMQDGAVGLSTGLIYLPGTFSQTEEIIELAKAASAHNGIYVSHMRDEGLQIRRALNELFRIAREADIPAHVSHIKLSGKSAWGQAGAILEMIDGARAEGLDITQDQYTYTASSTGISQLVPEWAREGGKLKTRVADPETRAKIVNEMKGRLQARGQEDYSYAVIASNPRDTTLNGLNIAQAAEKRLGTKSLDAQIDLVLDLVSQGSPSGVFHGMSEEDLQNFMRHPNTMFASDSGVRLLNQSVPHPRGYGNNARVLGRYARDEKVLRTEEAVRRMSSLPATVFGFHGRGQIQEGFWADLVLFNPQTVKDLATFNEPHQYPAGIEHVLVNGQIVLHKRQYTGHRPGQPIRKPSFKAPVSAK